MTRWGSDGRTGMTDTEVDFGWVLEVTFVVTVVIGVPVVAVGSLVYRLDTWWDRVTFAIPVAALVWLTTAVAVYGMARVGLTGPRGRVGR